MLGRGAFGEVFLGEDLELGVQFALKRTSMKVLNEGELDQIILSLKREISVSCICHCD
jgi:serine/threonine protein kinase